MVGGLSAVDVDTAGEDIEVLELLGEGSFGKVGGITVCLFVNWSLYIHMPSTQPLPGVQRPVAWNTSGS